MAHAYETFIEHLLEPFLEENGFEFVNSEYVKEAGQWFLRVYVDKEGGIDLDDCSLISEYLSKKLDEEDPIPNAYFLEVSSPGAERPLRRPKDFYDAIGKNVFVTTYEPIESKKQFEGQLSAYDEQSLAIRINDKGRIKQVEIPATAVASARLAVIL